MTTGEFDQALILTTPQITGQRVRDAQWLLQGNNVFKDDKLKPLATLTGRLDGKYGPVTAGAAKEAKYELGYLDNALDQVFGQELYEYLTGATALDKAQVDLRIKRLGLSGKIKALNYAITQDGYKEQPFGSNRQKYGAWYGFNGVPWCAIFVSYCINEALGTLDHPHWKYSYVPNIAHDAQMGLNHMSITFDPQPGDLVTYNWDGPNCHVEFYKNDLGGGSFRAVGGNTGSVNQSNGGEVAQSIRYHTNVSHFVRLTL